jgi:septum formation protein
MEEIILASTSPRRQELLTQIGLPFRVAAPAFDEETVTSRDNKSTAGGAEPRVKALAFMKAKSVLHQVKANMPLWIAGFDTLIEFEGSVLGKADSEDEAFEMLSLLAGKVHRVFTGIALYSRKTEVWDIRAAMSEVKFAPLTRKEIDFYLSTGEWQGAAGSYRIQERGSLFIEWIKGSYSNIVGLPIFLFYVMLKNNNYSFSLRQGN